MHDIQIATQDLVEQVLEFLDDAPIKMGQAICHDELYDLCYNQIINDLVAEEENRREEEEYEQSDTED